MDLIEKPIRSGVVAIVGPPNGGKSTLMNYILGQKISIVTPKPQTTRNQIVGIVNGVDHQIAFLDTPGLHNSREPLNVEMVKVARDSLLQVDLVLFLVDVFLPRPGRIKKAKVAELGSYMKFIKSPALMIINKIDLIDRKKMLPVIDAYRGLYPFRAIVPTSALNGDGIDILLKEIIAFLPMGQRFLPEDIPTNASERFLCAEIVREKVFLQTDQEIPYSTAVIIESFTERKDKKMITIHASIVLEKKSQKGIVIGKGGKKLKNIGIAARKDIETLIGKKVFLQLWVKIKKNWPQDKRFLKEIEGRVY